MDLGLEGKVAVVTGASRGIGLAVTRTLAEEGATVVAGARELSEELAVLDHVHPVQVDLGTPDGPARLVEEAVSTVRRRSTCWSTTSGRCGHTRAGSSPSPTRTGPRRC